MHYLQYVSGLALRTGDFDSFSVYLRRDNHMFFATFNIILGSSPLPPKIPRSSRLAPPLNSGRAREIRHNSPHLPLSSPLQQDTKSKSKTPRARARHQEQEQDTKSKSKTPRARARARHQEQDTKSKSKTPRARHQDHDTRRRRLRSQLPRTSS